MTISGEKAQELLLSLFATSVVQNGGSDLEHGVHLGISIALAVVTDGIPDEATSVDPNGLALRGHQIFTDHADKCLVDYLEKQYAMDAVER